MRRAPAGSPGWEWRCTAISAACAERIPLVESSIATQAPGSTLEPPRRLQVDVGRRLAARDLLRGDGRREGIRRGRPSPGRGRSRSCSRRWPVPAANAAPRERTASTAPGSSGSRCRYCCDETIGDLGGDPAPAEPARRARRACTGTTRSSSCRACPTRRLSFQWPPVSSVNSLFTSTHAASESSRTPSRSKTTAAISLGATQALLRAMRSSRPSIVAFSPAPSAP